MLKNERLKKDYTQEELSELTKVDPRTKIVVALDMTDEEIGKHKRSIALQNLEEK